MIAGRIALVLALLASLAQAETRRKAAPTRLEKAAGRAFEQALEAEAKGDLANAANLYKTSLELATHPNTVFNLAEVRVAQKDYAEALLLYELYLVLEASARDRAQVETTIAELRRKPASLRLAWAPPGDRGSLDTATAYVLVDGKIVSKPGAIKESPAPPLLVPVSAGYHTIDIVTDITYVGDRRDVEHAALGKLNVSAPIRVDGNVVFHTGQHISIVVDGKDVGERGIRMDVPAGRRRLKVLDRGHECSPITLDVAAGDTVTYVHVAPAELVDAKWQEAPIRCRKLTVTRHELTF